MPPERGDSMQVSELINLTHRLPYARPFPNHREVWL